MVVRLTRRPLRADAAETWLARRAGGAVVVFSGRVRPDRQGRAVVVALDYEVDRVPALAQLQRIERTAHRRFRTSGVVLWHRLGRVPAGEVSVVTGAAAGHRREAFLAARYLIDTLKATVPIWKEERARSARRPRPPRSRRRPRSAG